MARASRPMQAARHVGRFASTPPRRQRQPWAACSASSDRGPWYQAGPSSPDDLLQLLRQRHQAAAGGDRRQRRGAFCEQGVDPQGMPCSWSQNPIFCSLLLISPFANCLTCPLQALAAAAAAAVASRSWGWCT
jgi:hypothetical protein